MNRHRAARQKLEDLRRSGVTHIPVELAREIAQSLKASAAAPSTGVAATSTNTANRPTPVHSASTQGAVKPAISVAATSPANVPVQREVSASEQPTPATSMLPRACSNLSRDERIAQLSNVALRVAQCMKCEELARLRTQTVFGVGNPEAKIMFIGEAPGGDEDLKGVPFVGAAGQLLDKIIKASKLTREELYICNVLRCRPPGNRTPTPQEADNCREFLDAQIALVSPEYIVCWGAVAAQNLLRSTSPIGRMRGRFFDYQGIKVLCTYHPSYLLRNEAAKKDVWEDMKFMRRSQGVVID